MDKKFVMTGLGYGILGLALGIFMAATKNHGQLATHAHIMLLGLVVSFIYGVCHKLWLHDVPKKLATIQFYLHQTGTLVLLISLFLMYGGYLAPSVLGPVLGIASIVVLAAMVMMKVLFIKASRS